MATSFSLPQRILHWLMAALILFNLLFAEAMETWGRIFFGGQTPTPEQVSAANIHAYVGIAVLALGFLRLCLRFIQGAPPEPKEEPPLLRMVAKISHWAFMRCSSSCRLPASAPIISETRLQPWPMPGR